MDQVVFYSIIIPHFNVSNLLDRCLASIPPRDDLQIIVVDDCSCEGEKKLLEKLKDKYKSVEFFYLQHNQGGGAARNIGLRYAKGRYVLFADADDFFLPVISILLEEYKSKDFDVAFFNANSVDSEKFLPTKRASYLNKIFKLYNFSHRKGIALLKYSFGEPWGKIIRKKMLDDNQIYFDETKIHNDTKFSYLVGFYSEKVLVDSRCLYCITERLNSVSKAVSDEKQLTRLRVFAEKNLFFKMNKINFFDEQIFYPFVFFKKNKRKKMVAECYNVLEQYDYNRLFFRIKLFGFECKTVMRKIIKRILL